MIVVVIAQVPTENSPPLIEISLSLLPYNIPDIYIEYKNVSDFIRLLIFFRAEYYVGMRGCASLVETNSKWYKKMRSASFFCRQFLYDISCILFWSKLYILFILRRIYIILCECVLVIMYRQKVVTNEYTICITCDACAPMRNQTYTERKSSCTIRPSCDKQNVCYALLYWGRISWHLDIFQNIIRPFCMLFCAQNVI